MATKRKAGTGKKRAASGQEEGKATESRAEVNVGKAIRDSAQEIWFAGLGAYSRARNEGSSTFETLVKMGQELQAKSRAVADSTREALAARAAGTWGKVEQVFEERVSRSLAALGVPTGKDFGALSERIEALNENVQRLVEAQRKAVDTATRAATGRARKAAEEWEKASRPVAEEVTRRVRKGAEQMSAAAAEAAAMATGKKPSRGGKGKPPPANPVERAAQAAMAGAATARKRAAKVSKAVQKVQGATAEAVKSAWEDVRKE